jgi:hypothetical protein
MPTRVVTSMYYHCISTSIGSAGQLAPDIHRVRMPLGVLSRVTGDAVPSCWGFAQQRAFDTVTQYVAACAPHCRVPLQYGSDALPIFMMTDASLGGVVALGADWKSAKVAAFFSVKAGSRTTPLLCA